MAVQPWINTSAPGRPQWRAQSSAGRRTGDRGGVSHSGPGLVTTAGEINTVTSASAAFSCFILCHIKTCIDGTWHTSERIEYHFKMFRFLDFRSVQLNFLSRRAWTLLHNMETCLRFYIRTFILIASLHHFNLRNSTLIKICFCFCNTISGMLNMVVIIKSYWLVNLYLLSYNALWC